MDITIDRNSQTPIYLQIVERIRDMITSGALPCGFKLPPERRLASALGVNRSTVLTAYRELKADALVDAHVGRGTTVLARGQTAPPQRRGRELPWRQLFRDGGAPARDPVLRDLLELTERDDVISLSVGLPAPELFPLETFRSLIADLLDEVGAPLLQYGPTEGVTALRESLARWIATRGIYAQPADVMLLSGSQQGLDLAARVLLEPGDVVIVEEPSYIGALEVFRSARARIVGVPIDCDGMQTDILASVLERHRAKLIYTLPTFQNPSGAVLSLERRRHLLELADRHQVPIVEDDPYSELRYDGEAVPSLKSLDSLGHVIYLSTFSKVLFPGLRLGFMVAARPALRRFVLAKQSMDLHSSTVAQWFLDRFIRDGLYEPHLQLLREAYGRRRNVMEQALITHARPGLSWTRPAGGFYFWCRLPDGIEPAALLRRAAEGGVSYLPGWTCFAHEPGEHYARLDFSYPPDDQIRDGITRLVAAIDQVGPEQAAPHPWSAGTRPIV